MTQSNEILKKAIKDVRYGYVSVFGARENYGVVIDAENLELN